eukprot:823592-Pyramimonas_sp.AAC.2
MRRNLPRNLPMLSSLEGVWEAAWGARGQGRRTPEVRRAAPVDAGAPERYRPLPQGQPRRPGPLPVPGLD